MSEQFAFSIADFNKAVCEFRQAIQNTTSTETEVENAYHGLSFIYFNLVCNDEQMQTAASAFNLSVLHAVRAGWLIN